MKWLTDKTDIGLADGLILFLLTLYYGKKAVIDNLMLTRMDLAVLTLTFLYFIVLQIRAWNARKSKLEGNLVINR